MLGFSFRGSRVSVFLRALVRRLYSATARRSLSAVRAGSGSVKMLNAESTICRSAKTTARESSGVKRTVVEREQNIISRDEALKHEKECNQAMLDELKLYGVAVEGCHEVDCVPLAPEPARATDAMEV